MPQEESVGDTSQLKGSGQSKLQETLAYSVIQKQNSQVKSPLLNKSLDESGEYT